MIYQRTIAKKISVTGIGLHFGKKVVLSFCPAPENYGICFQRVDLPHTPILEASVAQVSSTENRTTIGRGEEAVHTVEHLLAVVRGLGLDNLRIEIDGPEVPIMDGSGEPFIFLLKEAGIVNLDAAKKIIVITAPVEARIGDKFSRIGPADKLIIDATIDFPHCLIKKQRMVFDYSCENFIKEIARARTFGLLKDIDKLKKRGLIKGASLDNAILIDDFKVVNREGFRFLDECVRHKLLDTLGDMALLGHEIAGKMTTYKSGHRLNNILCRKILNTPSSYKIISASLLRKEILESCELPKAFLPSFS